MGTRAGTLNDFKQYLLFGLDLLALENFDHQPVVCLYQLDRSRLYAIFEFIPSAKQRVFSHFLIINVGTGPVPFQCLAFSVLNGHGSNQMPAILAVRSTLEASIDFIV